MKLGHSDDDRANGYSRCIQIASFEVILSYVPQTKLRVTRDPETPQGLQSNQPVASHVTLCG